MKALFADRMRVLFAILGSLLVLFVAWPLLRTITASGPDVLWQTLLDEEVRGSILLTFYASLVAIPFYRTLGYETLEEADFEVEDGERLRYARMAKSLDAAPGRERPG